jgi:hypothetical protein
LYYSSVDSIDQASSFFTQDAVAICAIKGILHNAVLMPEELDGEVIARRVFSPKALSGHIEKDKDLFLFIASKLVPNFCVGLEFPEFTYQLYENRVPLGTVKYVKLKGWEFSKAPSVYATTAPGAVMAHQLTMLESLTVMKLSLSAIK